jgi:hypothetical protein
VSHAWRDKTQPQFGELQSELGAYDLWLDKGRIGLGESIRDRLEEGLRDADLVLVLWSAAAANSADVRFELSTAGAAGKDIIACLLDDQRIDDEPVLRGRLCVDLRRTAQGALGWRVLKYHLTQTWLAKNEELFLRGAEDAAELEERRARLREFKAKQEQVRAQLSPMVDSAYRIGAAAEDRHRENPYMLRMVRSLQSIAALDGGAGDPHLAAFMTFVPVVFERLPADDPETVKFRRTLFGAKLDELDPDDLNPRLHMIRAMLH